MNELYLGMCINYQAPNLENLSILPSPHPPLAQIFSLEICSQTPAVYALPLI
jgi:hypothetical protein